MKIQELASKIINEELTADERQLVSKLLMLVSQTNFEKSRGMFISGIAGKVNSTGLPEYLFVCPEFGSDIQCTTKYKMESFYE